MMLQRKGWFLMAGLFLMACGRTEKVPLPENVQLLTSSTYKDWQLQKAMYTILDVTQQLPVCQQDDIYRFYADGQVEIRNGINRCTASEGEIRTSGTWSFAAEGQLLLVKWKNDQWALEVKEIQENLLKVKGEVVKGYQVTASFAPEAP